ncbi:MAG: ATP-binding protein [Pararhodobacter sp.]
MSDPNPPAPPEPVPAKTARPPSVTGLARLGIMPPADAVMLLRGLLARLAPAARVLAALAVVLGTVAILLRDSPVGAVLLVAATTMALMAIGAGFSLVTGRVAGQSLVARLQEAIDNDADPVLLTDRRGAFLATNLAIRSLILKQKFTPADLLVRWSAEPARVVSALIAEALAGRQARRSLSRGEAALRLSVHRVEAGGDVPTGEMVLVWRFIPQAAMAGRSAEALSVPILTLGPDARPVSANPALRQLVRGKRSSAPSEADDLAVIAPLLADTITALKRAPNPELLALPGPGGGQTRLAFSAAGLDGQRDIYFLPAWLAAGEVPDTLPRRNNFEEIPVALVLLGADGRILDTNRLARGLLGLAPGEHRFFWEVVEGLGRPVADWLEDAREGRALNRPEVLRATQGGQETYVQIILRRATGPGGDNGLVAVISDATELKSLEARFVQSQKMQAIGQLAGGVAHDFNNLLTAISGHCDLLLLNRDHFDPDYNDLVQIHQNANRAAALVRQLLAFSRKQTLKPEVLSVESLLEDLTHLLTRLVGERITLNLQHDPALGTIRADRRQLEQVVMNLVVNARDAMPMGGEIRIETQALRLERDVERARARIPQGDYAVIRVIDEGVGIPEDLLEKIFEPFFTTKRQGEGTGLGLSTAYGIVKQMGGWIFADSTEGTGTVFTLYFVAHHEGEAEIIEDYDAIAQAALEIGAAQSDVGLPAPAPAPVAERSGQPVSVEARDEMPADAPGGGPDDPAMNGTTAPAHAPLGAEDPVVTPGRADTAQAGSGAPDAESGDGVPAGGVTGVSGTTSRRRRNETQQAPGAGSSSEPPASSADSAAGNVLGAARPRLEVVAAPAGPARQDAQGGMVLLVEDEGPVRAFAARALRLKGYQVLEAEHGEQALELLQDFGLKVDIFVTDVIMPGIDGPTWVTQALTRRPGTPVVFVSGYTEDSLSAALSRIPRSAFLGKPFTLMDLSQTIERQLALRN